MEGMTITFKDGLIEGRGVVDEMIDGESLSRVPAGPEELGLERALLGRKDVLAGGEGLGALLSVKNGEDVADELELSLGFKEGLSVEAIV